jgi:hypothetical protein
VLLIILFWVTAGLAQAQTPEPTAIATPDATPAPTPEIEPTLAPVEGDARLIQIVIGLIPDLTQPIIEQIGGSFERSQYVNAAMWLVGGVVVVVALGLLYRSTPQSKQTEVGIGIATTTSTVLKQIDAVDPVKWTDIDNRILKLITGYLDDRIMNVVSVGVQAGIEMHKEHERANETAQGLHAATAPKPSVMPPPHNPVS